MSFDLNRRSVAVLGFTVLSAGAYVFDVVMPTRFETGRLAICLAVFTSAFYLGGCIQDAVKKIRAMLDATIGVAVQFGRDAEGRRRDAEQGELAVVRSLRPSGKGGKR
jgi:hypothetical protein